MAHTAAKTTPRKPYKPRDNTKTQAALVLMQRPTGATMEDLMNLTGWTRPAVRGFVVGPQFARLGYRGVRRTREDGTDAYFAEKIPSNVS